MPVEDEYINIKYMIYYIYELEMKDLIDDRPSQLCYLLNKQLQKENPPKS